MFKPVPSSPSFPKLEEEVLKFWAERKIYEQSLARRAGEIGGTLPAVLNAANEVAVEAFVNPRINFPSITETVSRTMEAHAVVQHPSLEAILAADAWARQEAEQYAT